MPPASIPETPAMLQYRRMKAEHPDALLFFRMGDFYEMFFEDAEIASRALGIALTSRSKDKDGAPVPMCGVPHHAAAGYVSRLVRLGHRVALCEQMEDPKTAKGVVRREVVRIVTPGTQLDATALDGSDTSWILAVDDADGQLGGAWLEPTTGEFTVAQWDGSGRWDRLQDEIGATRPREILVRSGAILPAWLTDPAQPEGAVSRAERDAAEFQSSSGRRALLAHFEVANLVAFGCEELPQAVAAAGAVLRYVKETQRRSLDHVTTLSTRGPTDVLVLDGVTRRNLELVENLQDGSRRGTLLSVLDLTRTAMGSRSMREWRYCWSR